MQTWTQTQNLCIYMCSYYKRFRELSNPLINKFSQEMCKDFAVYYFYLLQTSICCFYLGLVYFNKKFILYSQ